MPSVLPIASVLAVLVAVIAFNTPWQPWLGNLVGLRLDVSVTSAALSELLQLT